MKISRPGSSQPSATASKPSGVRPGRSGDFAAKLEEADKARAKPAAAPRSGSTAANRATSVSDIASDLRAARITPEAAIDKVIDRIVARQLGIHASPAAREKIGAALRERLADDPLLAAKVRTLSEEI